MFWFDCQTVHACVYCGHIFNMLQHILLSHFWDAINQWTVHFNILFTINVSLHFFTFIHLIIEKKSFTTFFFRFFLTKFDILVNNANMQTSPPQTILVYSFKWLLLSPRFKWFTQRIARETSYLMKHFLYRHRFAKLMLLQMPFFLFLHFCHCVWTHCE